MLQAVVGTARHPRDARARRAGQPLWTGNFHVYRECPVFVCVRTGDGLLESFLSAGESVSEVDLERGGVCHCGR
jgi:hypothetical protein